MPFIKNLSIFAKKVVAGGDTTPRPFISTTYTHNMVLKTTGRLFGWGDNSYRQIGSNASTNPTMTPVSVAGAVKTFCKIAAGNNYTIAISNRGRLWAWGNNGNNQLGDNTTTQRNTPVSVLGAIKTFCEISLATQGTHTLAIDKNGRLWAWGANNFGKLGDNSVTQRATPVSVAGGVKTFCKIGGGNNHSNAIDKNGRAWSWGANFSGQLGDNSSTSKITPISVLGAVKTFCQIATGQQHVIVIDKNGRSWGWGQNNYGQLGDNSTTNRSTPVSVLGVVKTFCQISAGIYHSAGIDKNGKAWCWGYNDNGQLGDGTQVSKRTPISVYGTKTFCRIQTAFYHTIAVDSSGNVWSWGEGTYGLLGNNATLSKITPVSVLGAVKTFCEIQGGPYAIAADKNGRLWSWGENSQPTLAINVTGNRYTPVSVLGATKTFCKVAAGQVNGAGLTSGGRIWAWGYGFYGTVGDNSGADRRTPVSVAGAVKTFCHIAMSLHGMGITRTGRIWCWGYNQYGQVGVLPGVAGTRIFTPMAVIGTIKTFCKIAAGQLHSIAIDQYGKVWCWGYNGVGQLGNNSTLDQCSPVSVVETTTKTFCKIAGGGNHTLAIDKNGRAWGWGTNANGMLGDNTTTNRCTPVSVAGTVKTFCEIAAGSQYSLAIDKNGKMWGWGANAFGNIGDNSVTTRITPFSIYGTKTFCKVGVNNASNTSYAIDKNGRVWTWGWNDKGALGINEGLAVTPIRVCTL